MKNRLLGREPVITVSVIVATLVAILPVFDWPAETVGVVAGALVVAGGAVEAALISVDRLLPLLVGAGKAVLAVLATFGLHLPDNQISAVVALLTVIAGLQVRQQVVPAQTPKRDGRDIVDWRYVPAHPLSSGGWVQGTTELFAERDPNSDEPPPPDAETHRGERDGGGRD
jgi:hypothetical protein